MTARFRMMLQMMAPAGLYEPDLHRIEACHDSFEKPLYIDASAFAGGYLVIRQVVVWTKSLRDAFLASQGRNRARLPA
jgi:hypothetical protein